MALHWLAHVVLERVLFLPAFLTADSSVTNVMKTRKWRCDLRNIVGYDTYYVQDPGGRMVAAVM